MLDRNEIRDIAAAGCEAGYFVSLYLNVDPLTNKKGDYAIHFKNMIKDTVASLDKETRDAVKEDIKKIEDYVAGSRDAFRKGLALISSARCSFWKVYHLAVPVRNELVVAGTPYTGPLLDIADNYERYAVLLVEKEEARIFVIHLGEIEEYGEIASTQDAPGKHKKGGWFALAQDHYERHIDFHVRIYLREVIERLASFLDDERVRRLIIGGSDEAVSATLAMLDKTVREKIIGTIGLPLFAKKDEVLAATLPMLSAYEHHQEEDMVEMLITQAMKDKMAVLGLPDVLQSLQEQRVMRLVTSSGYDAKGFVCSSCGFLSAQSMTVCPSCGGPMGEIDHVVDLAGEMAVRQGAAVEVVHDNKRLDEKGKIGAFLRF